MTASGSTWWCRGSSAGADLDDYLDRVAARRGTDRATVEAGLTRRERAGHPPRARRHRRGRALPGLARRPGASPACNSTSTPASGSADGRAALGSPSSRTPPGGTMTTPDPTRRFDGRVALLTGAASGIGRSVALRLAAEGATVFGVDINAAGLDETAASVAEAGRHHGRAPGRHHQPRRVPGDGGRVPRRPRPARRAGQHRRHGSGRARGRRRRGRLPPDDGGQRRRRLLPGPGRHPAPARVGRQHRQHRLERRAHGAGLHRRLLHDQGRHHPVHPRPGHGVHQDARCG